ncbi:MAG: two-component system sensor histidine kinase CreC [Planctomycetota bacterium]
MSLRLRLILLVLAICGLSVALIYRLVVDDLRPRYLETMEESMVDSAEILAALLAGQADTGDLDLSLLEQGMGAAHRRRFSAQIYALTKTQVGLHVLVTDATGTVRYSSADANLIGKDFSRWNDIKRTLAGSYGARASRLDPDDSRSSILHVAAPILRDGHCIGVVSVSKAADTVTLFINTAQRQLLGWLIVVAVSVISVGMIASLWISRPMARLVAYAGDLAQGKRSQRPQLHSRELRHLLLAVENLRDALDGKQDIEQYVQHLTHELKSPLSAIRAAAELLEEQPDPDISRRFIANIGNDSQRLHAIIDRLLNLSSLEAQRHLNDAGPINLQEVAAEVCATLHDHAQSLGVTLDIAADLPIVHGERQLLIQVVDNLIANAIDFAPGGSTVSVTTYEHGFAISDQGPGIPAYARERVFERFYSLPRPRSGRKSSGLGLAMVKEAIALHGGTVTIAEQDHGTTIRVTFPAVGS